MSSNRHKGPSWGATTTTRMPRRSALCTHWKSVLTPALSTKGT